MKHLKNNLLLVIAVLFPLFSLLGQTMSFTDILKLYKLDSTAARQFCQSKQFALTDTKNDGATKRYAFIAADSSGARLELMYPNDSASVNVQLNYWFTDAKAYNNFKTAFKKQGFALKAAKKIEGTLPARAERYVHKNQQIELIQPDGKQPYWLFLHPVGAYTW